MQRAREYFDDLNHAYVAVHQAKEDLLWRTYMGTSDDQNGFVRAESAYKEFVGDPARLSQTRDQLALVRASPPGAERDALLHGLTGWLAVFEANIIDSPQGIRLMREIVDAESTLFEQKRAHEPRHLNDQGEWEVASLPMLATNLVTNRVEERRRSSFEALRGIERWVLDHGFLIIPHLLNQESAASYQGHLLASMAVSQTRAHFLHEFGYLTDNPAIGPALSAHYWEPGNSVDHDSMLRGLTGEGFSARYLADDCNRSVDEAAARAEVSMRAASSRRDSDRTPASLDAHIRIVHGSAVLADSGQGEAAMCDQFEAWVSEHYPVR